MVIMCLKYKYLFYFNHYNSLYIRIIYIDYKNGLTDNLKNQYFGNRTF